MSLPLESGSPQGPGQGTLTGRSWGLLACVLGVAAALRLSSAGQSLGVDEAFSVWMAGQVGDEFWQHLSLDSHPPLLYLLLRCWVRPDLPELLVRLPGILLGLGVVGLVAAWSRERAANGGEAPPVLEWLLPPLLVATSSWLVTRDAEMRQYTLLSVLVTIAMAGFWRAMQGAVAGWWAYGVGTVLSLFTQYLAFLLLPVPWLHLPWVPREQRRRVVLGLLAAQGTVLLLFAPWVPRFIHQATHAAATAIQGFSQSPFAHTFFHYVENWVVLTTLGAGLDLPAGSSHLVALLAVVVAIVGWHAWPRPFAVFLACFLLVPVGEAGLLYAWRGMNVFTAKHACFLAVPWFLLVGRGLAAMLRRQGSVAVGGAALLGVCLVCNLLSWWIMRSDPPHQNPPWREIAALVRQEARSGDAVLVVPEYHTLVYAHYAHDLAWPLFSTSAARAGGDAAALRQQFRRVWVIQTYHAMDDPGGRVAAAFAQGYDCEVRAVYPSTVGFDVVTVLLCRPVAGEGGRPPVR